MKLQSLTGKLTKIVSFSILLSSLSITVIIYNIIKTNLLLNLKTSSEFLIEKTKSVLYPTIDLVELKNLINEVKKDKNVYYFLLYDTSGNVLYIYINPYSQFKPQTLEENNLKIKKIKLKFVTSNKKQNKSNIEDTFLFYSFFSTKKRINICAETIIPVYLKEEILGIVQLGQDGRSLYNTLRDTFITLLGIFSLIFIGTVLITYFILKSNLKPINTLSNIAEEIANGNLSISIPLFSNSYEIYNLSMKMQHMIWGLRERETIKNIFGKYIDKKLVDKILQEKSQLKGVRKEVVVFYIDMQEFTKFTEQTPPEEVVSTLNQFFTIAIDAIIKHDGIVDKLIGDAVLSLFGAIEQDGKEAEKSVLAAIEFILNLRKFNEERKQKGLLIEIKAGTTIHIGEVIVGNIGHQERMEFTVVGDAVNTASRMQLYNRQFNIPLLFTKEVVEKLPKEKFETKFVSKVNVRGKIQSIELYTLANL